MTSTVSAVLVAFVLFQLKHFLCDFVLQTPFQFRNKGSYGHPGGVLHAGLHVLGTIPVLVLFAPRFGLAAAIIAGEFLIHYHIDWTKELVNRRMELDPNGGASFWIALGADQLLHQLTYVGIIALLIS